MMQKYIDELCTRLDDINPHVQAFLPEANRHIRLTSQAHDLEYAYPEPSTRPPLFGVPIGVKDIFHVDGFLTRAGSALPPDLFAGAQGTVVTRLQDAGALILGKTVTTEFAYIEPGPTRNPHRLTHTPGGSSSGSAAAVAAGLCPLALGTQTVGSVIRPAAYCGVVGFKPSFGRVDRSGVVMISQSLDHVGFFTQDVEGMALVASLVCDDWQPVEPAASPVLLVPDGPYLQQASPEGLTAFEDQLTRLREAGFTVRRAPMLDDIAELAWLHRQLMAAEMAGVHAEWFAQYEADYRPRTAALIRDGQRVDSETLHTAREKQVELRERIGAQMTRHEADLICCPSAPGPAPQGIESTGDPAMNQPWTFAGVPVIGIPVGLSSDGLPLGLQLIAPFGADEKLLASAQAYESFFRFPGFAKS